MKFDGARAWLRQARKALMGPIAAEVGLFDEAMRHVVLARLGVPGRECRGR